MIKTKIFKDVTRAGHCWLVALAIDGIPRGIWFFESWDEAAAFVKCRLSGEDLSLTR